MAQLETLEAKVREYINQITSCCLKIDGPRNNQNMIFTKWRTLFSMDKIRMIQYSVDRFREKFIGHWFKQMGPSQVIGKMVVINIEIYIMQYRKKQMIGIDGGSGLQYLLILHRWEMRYRYKCANRGFGGTRSERFLARYIVHREAAQLGDLYANGLNTVYRYGSWSLKIRCSAVA